MCLIKCEGRPNNRSVGWKVAELCFLEVEVVLGYVPAHLLRPQHLHDLPDHVCVVAPIEERLPLENLAQPAFSLTPRAPAGVFGRLGPHQSSAIPFCEITNSRHLCTKKNLEMHTWILLTLEIAEFHQLHLSSFTGDGYESHEFRSNSYEPT